tara:strand:+ start:17889 stop:18164 length:276 start_codon:yes stop_codon:yes gene_type:complete
MSSDCGSSTVNKTFIIESGESVSGGTCTFGPITFAIDATVTDLTYLGYGTTTACKILRVLTTSGATYTSFWSNGEEDLDKIWVDRATYPYF